MAGPPAADQPLLALLLALLLQPVGLTDSITQILVIVADTLCFAHCDVQVNFVHDLDTLQFDRRIAAMNLNRDDLEKVSSEALSRP